MSKDTKSNYYKTTEGRAKQLERMRTKELCDVCDKELNKYAMSKHKRTDRHLEKAKLAKVIKVKRTLTQDEIDKLKSLLNLIEPCIQL